MEKLEWLQANAASNTEHRVEVTNNEKIEPQTLSYTGKRNVTVRLSGTGGGKSIILAGNGSLFTIESGVTLMLDKDITLQGHGKNDAALVRVGNRGVLVVNEGGLITGNTNTIYQRRGIGDGGGGVIVMPNGNLTVAGGEVSGNACQRCSGGGVAVESNGNITMTSGEISGNTGTSGSGVSVSTGGRFTMSGGKVSGNTAPYNGGGVALNGGIFTMTGGEISGNNAGAGGGVGVDDNGIFTMTGGEISGNNAGKGGGVYFLRSLGNLVKTGGVIYGDTVGDINSNRASSSHGHAVLAEHFGRRQTTAGPRNNLDSNKGGVAGGWED